MFGKAITHFIRISAILHCFEIAFEILTNLKVDNKFVLSLKLKDQIDEAIEMKGASCWLIEEDILVSARNLLDYFVLNRLILAGYNSTLSQNSNNRNIKSIIKAVKDVNQNTVNITLAKHILLSPGNTVDCMQIVSRKLAPASDIVSMFQYLSNNGLGIFSEIKNPTGVSTKTFRKTDFHVICNDIDLIFLLETFSVDLKNYQKCINMQNIGN